MAHKYYQGLFKPKNPEKYVGNLNNIVYRSGWEKKVMIYLDGHPSIIKWNSEEVVIPYISPLDNRPHRYFPDFTVQVKTKSGELKTMIWEVKPKGQTAPPERKSRITNKYITEVARYGVNEAKWIAAKDFCSKRGWEFLVLTEHDLFGNYTK